MQQLPGAVQLAASSAARGFLLSATALTRAVRVLHGATSCTLLELAVLRSAWCVTHCLLLFLLRTPICATLR